MGSKKVVKQDPEADAQKAKDKATAEANREAVVNRRGATALSDIDVALGTSTALNQIREKKGNFGRGF